MELPKFSGDDPTSHESWKAVFRALVDAQNSSDGENILRLQNSLSVKALTMTEDLGYSSAAYQRADTKLENKYGGERRLLMGHLTTLGNWPKVRSRNLQDMEELQTLLQRILFSIKDCGPVQDQT